MKKKKNDKHFFLAQLITRFLSQNNEQVVKFSKDLLEKYGSGLSSVRFICGTQTIHKVILLIQNGAQLFVIIFRFIECVVTTKKTGIGKKIIDFP